MTSGTMGILAISAVKATTSTTTFGLSAVIRALLIALRDRARGAGVRHGRQHVGRRARPAPTRAPVARTRRSPRRRPRTTHRPSSRTRHPSGSPIPLRRSISRRTSSPIEPGPPRPRSSPTRRPRHRRPRSSPTRPPSVIPTRRASRGGRSGDHRPRRSSPFRSWTRSSDGHPRAGRRRPRGADDVDAAAQLLPAVVIPPTIADAVPAHFSVRRLPAGDSVAAAPSSITLASGTDARSVRGLTIGRARRRRRPRRVGSAHLGRGAATRTSSRSTRTAPAPARGTTGDRGPRHGDAPRGPDRRHHALFAETVGAPIGAVASGSSLLAVLAGYVLPGVAGPPATSIIMFMLVGPDRGHRPRSRARS